MLYDENNLPILEAGREERYTVKEAVKLLVEEQDKICSNTPLQVRTNLSFLVDISTLRCWRNLKSDMNGVCPHVKRRYLDTGSGCK